MFSSNRSEVIVGDLIKLLDNDDCNGFIKFLQEKNIPYDWKFPLNSQNLEPYLKNSPSLIAAAAYKGAEHIFFFLKENGAKTTINKDQKFPDKPLLHYAIYGGRVKIIQTLLNENADSDNILLPALRKGFLSIARSVYDQIEDLAQQNNKVLEPSDIFYSGFGQDKFPLKLAIESESIPTIDFVVEKMSSQFDDPDRYAIFLKRQNDTQIYQTALHKACKTKNLEVVDHIFELFPRYIRYENSKGQYPLEFSLDASSVGYNNPAAQELFQRIITMPDDLLDIINHGDKEGLTPLHYAAKYDNLEMVMNLLSISGIITDPLNKEKETPFSLAVLNQSTNVIDYLLQLEDATDLLGLLNRNDLDRNCLHHAARLDMSDVFVRILEVVRQADPSYVTAMITQKDMSGMSPIMWAAVYNSKNVFLSLLAAFGPDNFRELTYNDRVEYTGRTILHMAVNEEASDVIDLVLSQDLVDVNAVPIETQTTAMGIAQQKRNYKIIELLRRYNVEDRKVSNDTNVISAPHETQTEVQVNLQE